MRIRLNVVRFHELMDCWICGSLAETGEHMIKVSDLRDLFGHTTTKEPLYRRIDRNPQEIVQGVKSRKLKFNTRLCGYCNNTRTQPHDISWEALATFLRRRTPPIRSGEVVRPCPAFRNGLRRGLLGVHLYFIKLFGCLILDGKVPIDTQPLAQAILDNAPHPHVYLAFLAVTSRKLQQHAIVTPVETISINGNLSGAQWFYFVGRIGVHIIYAPAIHTRSDKVHLWHPSYTTKTLTLDGK
jgi:hypothetical protein